MGPFLMPLVERLGRRELRRRGFSSKRLSTAGGDLHLYDAPGSGRLPPTVILHGLGGSATPFGPMLGMLRQHTRRVVALDLPGHGFSAYERPLTVDQLIETVASALDATLDEPAMLIGNSLGGGLAVHYAFTHPERVRSLALVSPAAAPGSDAEWLALKTLYDIRTRGQGRVFFDRLYHSPPWFVPFIAHTLTSSFQTPAVRAILASAGNECMATPERLATLTMPLLLVWGRSERILPESHLEFLRRHLPAHSVIEQPEGFGHCPHLEAPRALVRRIVAFAERAHA